MDASKLQLKIFAKPGHTITAEAVIPVFHEWIKRRLLPDLLVDVANYAHVPHGPGIVLIGHATDCGIDESEGRQGLLFNRKRATPTADARLEDTFRRAFHVASLLEKEPTLAGKLAFATNELVFRINDRLAAPNTDATFAAIRPELEAFATRLFGAGQFTLARVGEPRQLFAVKITAGSALPLATLLERAGGPPVAHA